MQTNVRTARVSLIIAMLIFGTIGIFRNLIPMPSSVIALFRGTGGTLFLLLLCIASRKKLSGPDIRGSLFLLVLSGIFIMGDTFTAAQIIGVVVILLSVFGVSLPGKKTAVESQN